MPNSQPALGILKLGFRRWFERQLIQSHAYLVTFLLCLILVLAMIEELGARGSGFERALIFALTLCAGAVGLISFERYRVMLFQALHLSGRSSCGKCGAYGQFNVLDSARTDSSEGIREYWLKVRCRKCGHEWIMD
ncbi:MAG: hypothetical protein WBO23_14095 [Burkholderiales bacterium]